MAETASTGRSSWLSVTLPGLDADFERKLDLWGAYHRIAVTTATMVISFAILPQPAWLLWTSGLYLALAALVPRLLAGRSRARKQLVRVLVMIVDIVVLSLFVYRWGARASPAGFLYIPIVSGWTLIPQRHLGRASSLLALAAYGVLLTVEQHGRDLTSETHGGSADTPLLYFGMLACALGAVHGLVDFTVTRLREHSQVVTLLTAERHTRDREAQLAGQLEEAQRLEALGRLAGGIAHDFNNLLTVLLGCAELAELNLTSNATATRRALSNLQAAAERGSSLTAQLLDFASRRPARPENVDLNEAVKSSGLLLERLLEARVELRVQTNRESCVVHIDPGSLERLLLNLAINARDAMPNGGVLTISVSRIVSAAGEQVLLEVEDTGVGIAAKDLPHVFEPFFTTKLRGKGTGLGLASVYGIVKQSAGQLDLTSVEGVGTTFRMRWPRVEVQAPALADQTRPASVGSELVLLVDDDVAVRDVALAQLRHAGYTVLTASSGGQALALLGEQRTAIRLVVSDISMPGMSGIELAEHIREQQPSLPILLMSGYSEEQHGALERRTRFLAKPFSGQRLLAMVRESLDQKA
jgi:signal transduction histidine kinase/CheY-like chemotaxis protein